MPKKITGSFIKRFLTQTEQKIKTKKYVQVKGRVNAGKLNVREKPDLNSKVISQLKRGQIIDVFNEIGDWYQIVIRRNKSAFVYKKYIQIIREEKSGIVLAKILNIRSEPNTETSILGKLNKNDIITILQEYSDWLKILFKGQEAFVYKKYIEISDIPVELNPIVGSTTFFYERKDLSTVQLKTDKPIEVPQDYNGAIAANTWNNFGGLIAKISKELQIDVATAVSVLCVESSGKGFIDGRMVIRFENHVMDMFWGKNNPEKFSDYFKYDHKSRRNGHYYRESKNDKWIVCHTSQQTEWKVFELAKSLDETAALKSISMGAPQIMGFNYQLIGYKSPQEMFAKFSQDIRYHLLALFDFCKYKPERIRYLQLRDFYSFSVEYNGPTAPKAYEQRLLKFFHILKDILPK